jgi:hypothetical protein
VSPFSPRPIATAVLLTAGVAACANMGPPPGGDVDRDPLVIVASIPSSEAAGVRSDSPVTIGFGERPDRRSVMRALTVFPPPGFRETVWTDTSVTLVPESGWALGRNTIVRVARSATDRRGNAMTEPFQLRFTTKAVPDSGVVTGRVWSGQEFGSSHVVVVAAYPADAQATEAPEEAWPAAIDENLSEGKFRLTGLDTEVQWQVIGIADRDGDVRSSSSGEVWSAAPDMVVFRDTREVTVSDFLIGTLDSLGALAGDVVADSGDVAVVVAERDDDFREAEVLPSGGSFELTVPTGFDYRVGAFLDLDGDSLLGGEEPYVELDEPAGLSLTARRDGISFDLTGLGADNDATPDSAAAAEEDQEAEDP